MSRLKLARLRPENMKAKRKSEIVLSEEAKVELWALVNSWKAVRDKLHGLAEKKAEKKDYHTASEDYILSEGIEFCILEIEKLLPEK